jgi:DNA helicase HerA-like ATPase
VGELIGIGGTSDQVIGAIRAIRTDLGGAPADESVELDIELLGRLSSNATGALQFSRGIAVVPSIGSGVFRLEEAAIELVLPAASGARIAIGAIDQLRGRAFAVDVDAMLTTHFAIFGATGSGKTSAVVALLLAAANALPNAHIVILDPHGEYRECLGERARVWDRQSLRLPYWLLRFHELAAVFKFTPESEYPAETKVLRDAVMDAKRKFAGEPAIRFDTRLSLDSPLPYRLSDLRAIVHDRMSELKRSEPVPIYLRVLNRLDELTHDERFSFIFSAGYMHDMMSEVIGQFLPSAQAGHCVSIIDLTEVPDDALDVIVATVGRLLLALATWASPDGGIPALLVCEEASRYISAAHERDGRIGAQALGQIAREGRKYGVALGVVSQRPSQLSAEIVSQCGSIFVLRTSNQHDLDFIARALPDSAAALVEALPALSTGEAVAFGQAAPFPIRFRFQHLADGVAPRAKAAKFSQAWIKPGPDAGLIARAIARWREHGHLFHR